MWWFWLYSFQRECAWWWHLTRQRTGSPWKMKYNLSLSSRFTLRYPSSASWSRSHQSYFRGRRPTKCICFSARRMRRCRTRGPVSSVSTKVHLSLVLQAHINHFLSMLDQSIKVKLTSVRCQTKNSFKECKTRSKRSWAAFSTGILDLSFIHRPPILSSSSSIRLM